MMTELEHLRSWENLCHAWCCRLLCHLSMIDCVMFKLSITKYLSVFSVNYACLACYFVMRLMVLFFIFMHLHIASHLGTLDAPREG